MALALAGVAVMLGAPGEGSLAGDGLAFLAALAFAVMVVITRWRHDVSMAPATCLSQVILVVAFLPFASPGEIGGDDVVWLAALGIGQIGLGFALLTVGARLIPAAQVGLITLLEVVLGPLWVWLALDERPSTLTLVGGAIVIVAIVIQTRAAPPPEPGEERPCRRRTDRAGSARDGCERLAHRGRDLGAEELDRAHDVGVRERADAELDQEAVVAEDLVLEEDLLGDLLRAADEVRAAQRAGGVELLARSSAASRARGRCGPSSSAMRRVGDVGGRAGRSRR